MKNSGHFKKGSIPWNKGKKVFYTKEHLKKISDRAKKQKGKDHPMFGKHHKTSTKEILSKIGKTKILNKNNNWKGEKVSYSGIHKWIKKNFVNTSTCEICKTKNLFGRKINWASKNHTYTRFRKDWLRLCRKCHQLYDLGKINHI